MKICFLLSDISHTGGIERVTANLVQEISKIDSSVSIDIISQFRSSDKVWYDYGNCKIVYLSYKNYDAKPHSFMRFIRCLSNICSLRLFFKKNKYDYIISQGFPNSFMYFISGVNAGNLIAVEHVHYFYYGRLLRYIRSLIYSKIYKVVVLTNSDKMKFDRELPENKCVTIPNPVNITRCSSAQLINKQVIAIGRLEYQKGFDSLINVFSSVHKKHPEWILNIYGDGNLKSELLNLINEKNLSGVVFLRGKSEQILEKIRESSFFVLSSRFEGFPMVIAEAMTQGVPPISYNCPSGPSDMIKNSINGLLVDNQNEKALYEAICYLIENQDVRIKMGKQAFEDIKYFSSQRVAKCWITLLQEV